MQITYSVLFLLQLLGTVSSQKYCTMSTSKLSCTYDHPEQQSLSIQKTDIKILDLSGSVLNGGIGSSVKDYSNLEELSLSNCRIQRVENRTFAQLSKLIKLNLSDNLMTLFNSYSFDKPNALNVLILSNNLLITLSNIYMEAFPKLKVLDVSGNQLEYLPENILNKIQNDLTFSLYAGNNPWNCDNVNWKKTLEMYGDLKKMFCFPNSHSFLATFRDKEGKTISRVNTPPKREYCGFVKCKWWIIGSVWIGVILGNVYKLNKLLYQCRCRKKKAFEKAVGTETEVHHLMRQEKIAHAVEETEMKTRN